MASPLVPLAVACGAAGADTGADAVFGAGPGTDVAADDDSPRCGSPRQKKPKCRDK